MYCDYVFFFIYREIPRRTWLALLSRGQKYRKIKRELLAFFLLQLELINIDVVLFVFCFLARRLILEVPERLLDVLVELIKVWPDFRFSVFHWVLKKLQSILAKTLFIYMFQCFYIHYIIIPWTSWSLIDKGYCPCYPE